MSADLTAYTPCGADGCALFARGYWTVCDRHVERAGTQLAQLGSLYERLVAAPALGVWKDAEATSGGGLKSQRSPVNLDVLVARDPRSRGRDELDDDGNNAPAALAFVLSYAETVRIDRPLDGPEVSTFVQARSRLSANLDWILGQAFAGEFVEELRAVHRGLGRLTGVAIPRQRRSTCTADRDGAPCGGALGWDGQNAVCSTCAGSWSGLAVLRGLV